MTRGYVAGSERPVSPVLSRSLRLVAEFLSDEWIAALDECCRAAATEREVDARRLVVEPVVVGVPGRGEVGYRIAFDTATCRVTGPSADAPPADVRLETDYGTAVALARGEMNAQAALADGRLRVTGDVVRLAAHAAALARLDDLFSVVRMTTTYPEPFVRGGDEQS
jgi:SCP-2 sterol transfer family